MTVAGLKRRLTPGSKITWVNGYRGSGPLPLTVGRWKGDWLLLIGANKFAARIRFYDTKDEEPEPPNGFYCTDPDRAARDTFEWGWRETGEPR